VKVSGTLLMTVRRRMLSAIHLDDEATGEAYEVHDVRIDRLLPPELEARQLPAPQQAPERSLSVRHVSAPASCRFRRHHGTVSPAESIDAAASSH
jgi:hypothetical protein